MRVGYIAKVRGALTEDEQRELLAEIGCTRLGELGDTKDRRAALTDIINDVVLRPFDQLCVTSALIIAKDARELFDVVCRISELGATLYVADLEKAFWADRIHADLAAAFVMDRNEAQTAPARAKRGKNKGGRKPVLVLDGVDLEVFKQMWRDPAADIAAMQRRFTPKGRKQLISRHTIGRRADEHGLGPKR